MTKLPIALWTALQDRWFWPLLLVKETEVGGRPDARTTDN